MTRREVFLRVRSQVQLVRRLNEQMRELCPDGVRCLRTDTVSRGGGLARGLEVRLEKQEALERMIKRESQLLSAYEKEAHALMDEMSPGLYAFCAAYYINAMSIEEASEIIGRSGRQCLRYKLEVEAA